MVDFDGCGGSFVIKLGSLSHSGWAGTSKQVVKAGPKVVEGYGRRKKVNSFPGSTPGILVW